MHFIFPLLVMGYLCTNCAMPLYGIMYTGLGGKPPFTICILYIVTLMKVFPMREREREREREKSTNRDLLHLLVEARIAQGKGGRGRAL